METIFKDKKINIALFVFIIILSLFVITKIISEVKESSLSMSNNTIVVSGSGEVTAIPDIASIIVNLSKDGDTSKIAQSALNESITKTLEYLKTQNIEDKDIKSEYGGLNPKYSYDWKSRASKIIGYTASQSITIKVRDLDNANTIRTGLAELGITDISGPTFSIDNEESLKDEARKQAINEAREKAQVLALELGIKLGKIVSYSDDNNNVPMRYAKTMSVENDAYGVLESAPALPLGENKITSNVTVIYEIK